MILRSGTVYNSTLKRDKASCSFVSSLQQRTRLFQPSSFRKQAGGTLWLHRLIFHLISWDLIRNHMCELAHILTPFSISMVFAWHESQLSVIKTSSSLQLHLMYIILSIYIVLSNFILIYNSQFTFELICRILCDI